MITIYITQRKIIEKYMIEDKRINKIIGLIHKILKSIIYLKHKSNEGKTKTKCFGIRLAKGK